VVYPLVDKDQILYRLAWEVTQRRPRVDSTPERYYVSYVDAADGENPGESRTGSSISSPGT